MHILGESGRRLPDLCHDGDVLRSPRGHPLALLEDILDRQKPAPQSAGPKGRRAIAAGQG